MSSTQGAGTMSVWEERLMRAVLFVPGSDQRKLTKVGTYGADVVVIDLEDAVAETEKTPARAVTRAAIPSVSEANAAAVRVNGIDSGRLHDDIAAVTRAGLCAIVVPKVENADTLPAADVALARAERENGLPRGAVALIAIIETPLGIARCEEILLQAPSRTVTAIFGLADFSAALGVDVTAEGTELLYARGRMIVAARAAGMLAPIDGPYLHLDDTDGLLADSRRSRQLGFQGRVALHPRQVIPIQQAFSELTVEQAAAAQRIVEAFEGAETRGVASIRVDGNFVDYPVYRLARTKLRRYEAYLRTASAGR
jgi:citrate lyase subunit beta / citryl-CoA lyase